MAVKPKKAIGAQQAKSVNTRSAIRLAMVMSFMVARVCWLMIEMYICGEFNSYNTLALKTRKTSSKTHLSIACSDENEGKPIDREKQNQIGYIT